MARQKFSGEKELFHNAAKNNDILLLKKLMDNGFKSINCENEHDFNRTPLHKAAQNGHKNVVEYLISQGAEVNTTDKFGKTPLHFATGEESKDGELEIVKLLVEKGAQIDKKDNFGMTPALIASIRGHENLVNYFKNSVENEACKPNRELLNKTLEVLEKNEKKINNDIIEKEPKSKQIKRHKLLGDKEIFHNAAKNDDVLTLKKMMADGFKYINCEDEHDFNRTSLHKAAQNGHKDVVEYLISQGADVNATDMFGKMPIHFAAGEESKSGNLEIVKLLLEKGARLDKKDIYGNTPLLIASIRGHEKLVKYFQNHALEMAKSKSEMLPIEKSLDIPTEQQVLDKISESENNIDEIHKIWLDEDLEKIDKNMEKNPQSKRIEYLNGDKEIFHNAAKNGTLHTLKQLIVEEDFKYINCQDKLAYNRTPLHKAVNHKHIHQKFEKVVQYLLEQGADVNAKDTFGRTPTHIAVLMGQSEIVKILVEKGARLDVKDVFGNNTLQCASKSGYTYIAKYLKEIMENPNPTFEKNMGIVTKKVKINEMSETLKKDNEGFEKIVKQSGKRKTEANVDIAKPKRQNIVVDLDKTEKGIDEIFLDEDLEKIDKESKTKQLKMEPSNEIIDDEISMAEKVDQLDDCQNKSYDEIKIHNNMIAKSSKSKKQKKEVPNVIIIAKSKSQKVNDDEIKNIETQKGIMDLEKIDKKSDVNYEISTKTPNKSNLQKVDDKENEIEEIQMVRSKTKVEISFNNKVFRIKIPKTSVTLEDIKKHLQSQPKKFGMSAKKSYDFSVKSFENGKEVVEEIDDDETEDILPLYGEKIVLDCWVKS